MCMLCPSWLSFILYNPVRKAFTDRNRVLDDSLVTESSVVLEIGAGNGFFTEALAERADKVFAVELQSGMVRKLQKRVSRFGDKVRILLQDVASTDIEEGIADVCLLYYSFHEIRNQSEAVSRIAKAVKKGGILSIYEPSVEVPARGMERTVGNFIERGFVLEASGKNIFTRFARLRKS